MLVFFSSTSLMKPEAIEKTTNRQTWASFVLRNTSLATTVYYHFTVLRANGSIYYSQGFTISTGQSQHILMIPWQNGESYSVSWTIQNSASTVHYMLTEISYPDGSYDWDRRFLGSDVFGGQGGTINGPYTRYFTLE